MKKAVIFDMYETLITQYRCQRYFGAEIAMDAGIPVEDFLPRWNATDHDRTIGKLSLEAAVKRILEEHQCYSDELLEKIVAKRVAAKREGFRHLHTEIIPMLTALKSRGIRIGLISNCFSEEVIAIRESVIFPFFDVACLSYEEGVAKPDKEIFIRCMIDLSVKAEDCLYVGDGGSRELETAEALGMKAVQAVWYLKESQPDRRMQGFSQAESPLKLLNDLE